MQPLVPFVVLLSCSVSFIPPEKLLSVWIRTVDLGLSSGASAGEVSPQPFKISLPLYYNTAVRMAWTDSTSGTNTQLELPQAVWRMLYGEYTCLEWGMAVGI